MSKPSRLLLVPVAVLALLAAACGEDDDGGSSATTAAATTAAATTTAATTAAATTAAATTTAPAVEGDITVFAAASLTESFTAVGEAFTEANPDAKATFSFDASSALVQNPYLVTGIPARSTILRDSYS